MVSEGSELRFRTYLDVKFVVDGMLGRLARWLRLTGHDVAYANESPFVTQQDEALMEKAEKEGAILITSDKGLYRRARRRGLRAVLIQAGDLLGQLVEVSRAVPELEIDLENSRCPVCNGELEEVNREEVRGAVPDTVFEAHEIFWRCVSCGKIYWEGSHWKRILETLEEFRRRKVEAHA
jgi:uncharacterized protein with PIN domain